MDILFLGNSYYAFNIDPEVRDFIKGLDKDRVGIPMDEREFHCKGEFKGLHKGKPDDSDMKAAAEFAAQIVK